MLEIVSCSYFNNVISSFGSLKLLNIVFKIFIWSVNYLCFLFPSEFVSFLNFFFNRFYFYSSFRFRAKLSREYRQFSHSIPTHAQPHPVSKSPTRGGTFVTSVNLHWHIIITTSPQIRVHPWCCTFYGFDKWMTTCIYQYSIIQNSLTALNFIYASIYSLLPSFLSPDNYWSSHCLHSFMLPRMSYSWNHTECSLFTLGFSFSKMPL